MAQEWYLMNTNHDTVSGFESEDFNAFATDAFEEALASSLGADVEICSPDLSERRPKRVIIEGDVQDTKLNALNRRLLAPIGTCISGEYVFYKNRYWLIVGLVDDNGMYEKAVLVLCNYLLTWKNRNGNIVQRWVSASSASQYNNGETGYRYIITRSDQLMVLTPQDDECLLIPHGARFIMDLRTNIYERGFSDDVTVDTSKQLITYELTRIDNVIFNYQGSGHSEFMATQDEQHDKDGYYVIDGKGYWLCEEPNTETDGKTSILSCYIECDAPIIYNSLEPSVFTARFYNSEGNLINVEPQWEINCDFIDKLNIEYIDNSICISVDDRKLVNKSFELSLCATGYDKVNITIQIKAFI